MRSSTFRGPSRLIVALATLALLLFSVAPAFASVSNPGPTPPPTSPNPGPAPTDRGLIPSGVRVAGHAIGGMTEAEARGALTALFPASKLPALTVKAVNQTFSLAAGSVLFADVSSMLDEAYAVEGTATVDLPVRYGVNTRPIPGFVTGIAKKTDRGMVDARWVLTGNRLHMVSAVTGQRTDIVGVQAAIRAALGREAQTGSAQPTLVVPVKITKPHVTNDSLGKAILVVLSERRLRLYDKGSIVRAYRCAVGQPDWPTPTGLFHIVMKRYMPTWVNPGDSWGAGMPASIPPGPGNPLGTRAMNLDADGIRIHGTANVDSLGTAASHGCIRLAMPDVEQLFDLVSVGTPVYIVK
jgi:lipoprotein-anchoring transpeptidase ErfK/SrfK